MSNASVSSSDELASKNLVKNSIPVFTIFAKANELSVAVVKDIAVAVVVSL